MRKLPCKWPVWLTVFGFLPPLFYLFFRIGKPEIFSFTELVEKVFGGVFIVIVVWGFYGIACLFTKKWVSCGDCKFSDVIQESNEIKCQLTGYNYPTNYSCKKSKHKDVEVVN